MNEKTHFLELDFFSACGGGGGIVVLSVVCAVLSHRFFLLHVRGLLHTLGLLHALGLDSCNAQTALSLYSHSLLLVNQRVIFLLSNYYLLLTFWNRQFTADPVYL